jgi:V8-like Glu-specific endopeptidase
MRARASAAVSLSVLVTILGGFTTVGAADRGATAQVEPPGTPNAHHFRGNPTVGTLFLPGSSVHYCTASVVDSRTGDLLLTAAHCISGTAQGYLFAPDYHDGIEPFGSWKVVSAYGDPGWIAHRNAQRDFAFLVVAPRQMHGHREEVQQVTGANRLGAAPAPGQLVTVPAYALGRDDDPITCTSRTYIDDGYPAFNCTPYVDGTSGSPWLEYRGRSWLVVGVIGGLHQGGCYPWTSYSAAFGPATERTYSSATHRVGASTFPAAGSDGCGTGL